MDNTVTAFEHSCVEQVLERLQYFLLSKFCTILKEHGQLPHVLASFRVAVLNSSTFLLKLLPCEKELEADLVKKKKSLREYAKVFDLPLGMRVCLVNECTSLISAWQSWSVVQGGFELCAKGGAGIEYGEVNVRLEHSAVVVGNRLSLSKVLLGLGGYCDMLETFEVYSPAWSLQPLTLLVYNPEGLFSAASTPSDLEGNHVKSSSLSVQSFLQLCLQWLKCSNPQHQYQGHVSTAYFLRYIQHCWCLVLAPDAHSQSSFVSTLPQSVPPLPINHLRQSVVMDREEEKREESPCTVTLEAFLTQGALEAGVSRYSLTFTNMHAYRTLQSSTGQELNSCLYAILLHFF